MSQIPEGKLAAILSGTFLAMLQDVEYIIERTPNGCEETFPELREMMDRFRSGTSETKAALGDMIKLLENKYGS